jgi:uncharacterized damage-inducible protein DinB
MPTVQDCILFAAYNAEMNRKLYDAAARLPAHELGADRGAFFGSLLGTMNHLIAGDTIWLMRFARHPAGFAALAELRDAPIPTSLTQNYGDDLPTLHAHRMRLDGFITGLAAELRPADLEPSSRTAIPAAANTINASAPCCCISSITRRITAARPAPC